MIRLFRFLFVGVLIGGEVFGVSPRLALIRVEGNLAQEKAYRVLFKKLQRWIDEWEPSLPRPVVADRPLQSQAFVLIEKQNELELLSRSLLLNLERETESDLKEFESLRLALRQLPPALRFGPIYQSALLALAAGDWARSDRIRALESLGSAVRLNPELKAESLSLWESDSRSPMWSAFEVEKAQLSSQKLGCEAQVWSDPKSEATLFVNGFPFPKQRQFRLLAREKYVFQLVEGERLRDSVGIACVEREKIGVRFSDKGQSDIFPLSAGSVLEGAWDVALVAKLSGGEFKLYLYSRRVGLNEIPSTAAFGSTDIMDNPMSIDLPIDPSGFRNLVARYAENPLELNEPLISAPVTLRQGIKREARQPETQWYNNWKFWAVIGGVAGAAVLTYALTRDRPITSQQGSVSLSIR